MAQPLFGHTRRLGMKLEMQLRVALLVLTAVALAPPFLAPHYPLAAALLRSFFTRLCHQNSARSFMFAGSPVAVCVRCLGIYSGAALAALIPTRVSESRRWLAAALLLNVCDVIAETLHCYGNMPLPRFCLGFTLGMAASAVLFSRAAELTPRDTQYGLR